MLLNEAVFAVVWVVTGVICRWYELIFVCQVSFRTTLMISSVDGSNDEFPLAVRMNSVETFCIYN